MTAYLRMQKAVEEILPDCMQIADRFHLHQNLLEAVKSVINSTVPVDIKIPKDAASPHFGQQKDFDLESICSLISSESSSIETISSSSG